MATIVNPNNWHWVEKSCIPWAKQYLTDNLSKVTVEKDDYKATVTNVGPITGDCDITQRKGRVRCLIELAANFVVKVEKEGGEDSTFDISLPEFEHDQLDEDYHFQIKNGNPEYKNFLRTYVIPEVLTVFKSFQPDLLEDHRKTLMHNAN